MATTTRRLSRAFTFAGSGGEILAGRLELPLARAPVAHVVFAHCFTCGKDVYAAARVSRALAARGIGVLRFDFTGLGGSAGDFANTNFSSNVGDLRAAVAALRAEVEGPLFLIGHSLGGAAALSAALELDGLAGVATIGAPADPAHVTHLLEADRPRIVHDGEAIVSIAGRPFRIRRQFLDDIESHRLRDRLGSLSVPLMVVHAIADSIVSLDNAELIFAAASHPKSLVTLTRADHLLSRQADAETVADHLATWMRAILDAQEVGDRGALVADDIGPAVLVAETGDGRFTNVVRVRRHMVMADEPESVGGADRGPSPYEFLAAALGTCTSMTLRMYAERKQWPLEEVQVRVQHDRVHAQDCAECETRPSARIDRLTRTLRLTGPLSQAQRVRLLEIADKCPVHRTLEGDVQIVTQSDPG